MEQLILDLANFLGATPTTLKFVLCIVSCFPLCYIHSLMKNVTMKHIYSTVLGAFFLAFVYGPYGWIHSFITSVVTYAILYFCPRKHVPYVVFSWCFIYLSGVQLWRVWYRWLIWETDISAPQMILTIKLTSLGFNYFDGMFTDAELKEKSWIESKVVKIPTLLEYFSFVYYFGGVCGGPAFEFREYVEFTENKNWFPEGKKPSTLIPCLTRALHGFLSLIVYILLNDRTNLRYSYTPEFQDQPYLWKWGYLILGVLSWKCQYYFAWILSEAANILNGFGYNKFDKDGNMKWDRLTNVEIMKIEFCQNPREYTIYWNMTAAKWLRNHVYLRIPRNKDGQVPEYAQYVVMIFSAFWHGFYPGYYIHFLACSVAIHIARLVRRKVRPYFVTKDDKGKEIPIQPYKNMYDVLGIIIVNLLFAMSLPTFNGLSLHNANEVARSIYYTGHIGLLTCLILFSFIPSPNFNKEGKKTR